MITDASPDRSHEWNEGKKDGLRRGYFIGKGYQSTDVHENKSMDYLDGFADGVFCGELIAKSRNKAGEK